MDNILDLIFQILGGLAALLVVCITPKIRQWLVKTLGEAEASKLDALIVTLVKTAQQLLWDKTGSERKQFVLEKLQEFGYEFTDYIDARIEEVVFDIHSGTASK